MSDDSIDKDQPDAEDEAGLDAALQAGFGPLLVVADAQVGLSALAELERRLGSETRVYLQDESPQEAASATPPSGTSSPRYQMLGEIARGGMGIIVRSRDTDLGREVAMKVLDPRHAGNRTMVQRFVEEAQIAGQLQHPGILQVYELGLRPDKRPYCAANSFWSEDYQYGECIKGESIDTVIRYLVN